MAQPHCFAQPSRRRSPWPIRLLRCAASLGSAGATLLAGAGLAAVVLAKPAFRETRPGWLKRLDLAVTFYDRDGREFGRRGIRHASRLRLDELPSHVIEAVLATEDRRFRQHWGIDPVGLVRAALANAQADAVVQGGSTITQQLAKNLFLSGERTLQRKISEAFLALWLEVQLSKSQILKLYLDRAYMGAGTFGIEAAAERYFGKSVRDVTLAEAAALAGLLKAPSRYAPHLGSETAAQRSRDVLGKMFEAGFIARGERDAALAEPALAVAQADGSGSDYYLDWAFREVQRLAASGQAGEDSILAVDTPFEPGLQSHVVETIKRSLERDGGAFAVDQAAAVVMDPDGAVRALVGGRDYGESQFNRATDASRQPGSTFKPIVYAAALAHTRLRATSVVLDSETCIADWCPANYGRSHVGALPLATALAESINTVAVRLSIEIGRAAGLVGTSAAAQYGRARIIALGRSLGITTPLHDMPSLPLGASEVKLLDLTASFAAFAAGGQKAEPYATLRIRNSRDEVVWRRGVKAVPVLGPNLVAEMNDMLAGAVTAGTGRRAALPGWTVAGKTGTTSAYRDAWFVGFTAARVAGIWFGNDDFSSTRRLTGGALPAAAWREVMGFAHRGLAPVALPPGSQALSVDRGDASILSSVSEVRSLSRLAGQGGFLTLERPTDRFREGPSAQR